MANTIECYGVSERRACRILGQCRATQRYIVRKEEDRLRHHVIDLSKEYGRYGYKRITALLRQDGWRGVYQNKCVNGIYKKLKNNLVAEPVGPVKNGFFSQLIIYQPSRK